MLLTPAKCPECGANMMLKNGVIPSHLPGWHKGHTMCPASGWAWTENVFSLPWR